jgi:heptaprenyl diphosphate synthase
MHSNTQKIAELAIFTALAFIFSYIESLFPLPIPFPGIKLGLANLVIVILLYRSGFASALGVSLVRNILNALTFGSLFGLFYSLAGSILSLFAMEGLRRLKKIHVSTIVVSSIGGILHNIGQFMIAVFLVGYEAILHYFPFLYFAGLVAGILIGIFGKICLKKLPLLSNRS